MTDSAPGRQARELLAKATQHPIASPQRDALVAEAAVWARLEHAAIVDKYTAATVDIESALVSLADPVRKLASEVGDLTGRIKLGQK
ncbi:hypothetical protein [Streptomyces atratus]|uniref:hypothetical protein n=1 Tax=Streptomyces atratus TaxID=1893 RepID=UPI0033DD72D0